MRLICDTHLVSQNKITTYSKVMCLHVLQIAHTQRSRIEMCTLSLSIYLNVMFVYIYVDAIAI